MSGENVLPGDRITISKRISDESDKVMSKGFANPDDAKISAEKMANVPGVWWKLQSPPEFMEPTKEQSVVWAMMYGEGHSMTGTVGYDVFWARG